MEIGDGQAAAPLGPASWWRLLGMAACAMALIGPGYAIAAIWIGLDALDIAFRNCGQAGNGDIDCTGHPTPQLPNTTVIHVFAVTFAALTVLVWLIIRVGLMQTRPRPGNRKVLALAAVPVVLPGLIWTIAAGPMGLHSAHPLVMFLVVAAPTVATWVLLLRWAQHT